MEYTSSEAAKLLRKLNDEYNSLLSEEALSREFVAALSEDIESVRPEYDYEKTQASLEELEEKIRTVKHAINVFNSTHKVQGYDMTIDEMLIYIPQLSAKKIKLMSMKSRLPKVREASSGKTSSIIDYRIMNYDISKAKADYEKVSDELAKAQTALDVTNNSETFEIEI